MRARRPHRPPGCDPPNRKRSHIRSFTPSGIRSYHSFDSASASIRFLARHADGERGIGPTTHCPIPALVSNPSFPPCPPPAHPSIHECSARARAGSRAKACAPPSIPCVDTRALPPLPLSTHPSHARAFDGSIDPAPPLPPRRPARARHASSPPHRAALAPPHQRRSAHGG